MHVSGKWGELFLLGVVLIGNDTDLGFCLSWVVNIIKCLRTILFARVSSASTFVLVLSSVSLFLLRCAASLFSRDVRSVLIVKFKI